MTLSKSLQPWQFQFVHKGGAKVHHQNQLKLYTGILLEGIPWTSGHLWLLLLLRLYFWDLPLFYSIWVPWTASPSYTFPAPVMQADLSKYPSLPSSRPQLLVQRWATSQKRANQSHMDLWDEGLDYFSGITNNKVNLSMDLPITIFATRPRDPVQ